MAEADIDSTEFWDFDKAVRHVVKITGKPLRAAMREVTERICDDELPHYVNGAIPKGDPEITPSGGATLWRTGGLFLDIVKGRVEVVSTTVVVKGCDFRVTASDVHRLWPYRKRKKKQPVEHNRLLDILEGLGDLIQPKMRPRKVRELVEPSYREKYGKASPGGASATSIKRAYDDHISKGQA
jgi:hypothetical protein